MTIHPQRFYNLYRRDKKRRFYHHALVYTLMTVMLSPYDVDVVTSAAVNVASVRRQNERSVAREEHRETDRSDNAGEDGAYRLLI